MASAVLGVQSVWEPLNSSPFLFPPLSVSHLSSPAVVMSVVSFPLSLPLSHSFFLFFYLSSFHFLLLLFPFVPPSVPPSLIFAPPPHCHTSAAMCWVLWSSPIFNLGYKILFLNTHRNRGGDWWVRGINKKEVGKGKRILGPCGGYHPSPDFILSMVYKFLHCDATHVPCKEKTI